MKQLVTLASLLVLGGSLGVVALLASSARRLRSPPRGATNRTQPGSVAIGDLNGDGKPDLATANGDASTVSVLLNRGDGSFRAKRDYATGHGPDSVAIGDLNGDGKPDLATANIEASTVSVLLNRGDGSFQAKLDYATGSGPRSVAIGDLNGDGKPDLATANVRYANTRLRAPQQGRRQLPGQASTTRPGRAPASVAIGDLNGDGKPDLATANYRARTPSPCSSTGATAASRPSATTDRTRPCLGRDRRPERRRQARPGDRELHASANTVSVLLNRGDGSFQAKRDYRTGRSPDRSRSAT